jgi:predicted nucleotidyltransferase
MTTTDLTAAARTVADEATRAYQNTFTDRLVAVYLLGSLAYGGFAPAVSDIDLAVVLSDRHDDDPSTVRTTTEALQARGDLYRKLSVFWGSLPALRDGHDDGRFPALDRLELAEHGALLLGDDIAGQVARPASGELLLESARFAVTVLATDEVVAEFHHPRRLLADPVWFTKAVLFPVRFLHTNTTATGRAAPNDEAIAWYLTRPDAAAPSLVRLAERVRAGHPLDPKEIAPELAAGLVPLYQYYIDHQLPLLRDSGAPEDLVTAFTNWSHRLKG